MGLFEILTGSKENDNNENYESDYPLDESYYSESSEVNEGDEVIDELEKLPYVKDDFTIEYYPINKFYYAKYRNLYLGYDIDSVNQYLIYSNFKINEIKPKFSEGEARRIIDKYIELNFPQYKQIIQY